MKNVKKLFLVFALTVGISLSLVSAKPTQVSPVQATVAVEVQTVGGDQCAAALGLAAGLAIAALTPCSILCVVGAWYVGIGGAALLC